MSDPRITVYGTEYSGHAHRVVLLQRFEPMRRSPLPPEIADELPQG